MEKINLYFDQTGHEELFLSGNTCYEISGNDEEGFIVWEENNSEEFKTLKDAVNYIKLSTKNFKN